MSYGRCIWSPKKGGDADVFKMKNLKWKMIYGKFRGLPMRHGHQAGTRDFPFSILDFSFFIFIRRGYLARSLPLPVLTQLSSGWGAQR
jgi:hypothetical protein